MTLDLISEEYTLTAYFEQTDMKKTDPNHRFQIPLFQLFI
jgi:hypothetical protein